MEFKDKENWKKASNKALAVFEEFLSGKIETGVKKYGVTRSEKDGEKVIQYKVYLDPTGKFVMCIRENQDEAPIIRLLSELKESITRTPGLIFTEEGKAKAKLF